MQTFLPSHSFTASAKWLDNKRLGKQRVEVKQIYDIIAFGADEGNRWQHHPAIKMWVGHEINLLDYGLAMCFEWGERGFDDNLHSYFEEQAELLKSIGTKIMRVPWIGDKRLHDSHKSQLLIKDPEWYGKLGWDVPADLPYFWPL